MKKEKNIFLTDEIAKAALLRLKTYKKTVVRYELIEKFGLERLTHDLKQAAGNSATIKISAESFIPSDFIRKIPSKGKEIRVRVPLMPPVIMYFK